LNSSDLLVLYAANLNNAQQVANSIVNRAIIKVLEIQFKSNFYFHFLLSFIA